MIPVLTPEEMGAVDRSAPDPVEVLVGRAGAAVAQAAVRLLEGRVYGAHVVVIAGPGNNGADGHDASRRLRQRGAAVRIVDAKLPPDEVETALVGADVVIDAAFGTGLHRAYAAPTVPDGIPVLAVDIPSGLSGTTGTVVGDGRVMPADATVTFAALKPGLLLGEARRFTGPLELADIGLGRLAAERANAWLVTDADVADLVPVRPVEAHKWQTAVHVVAGSPGMTGASWMVSRAAMRAGAGYVRLGIPGVEPLSAGLPPGELVSVSLPESGWEDQVLDGLDRFKALVIGPGLGGGLAARGPGGAPGPDTPVFRVAAAAPVPVLIDADGLNALGDAGTISALTAKRSEPTVITPHAGEYARLFGDPPSDDRLTAVREAAERTGAVVLLKGSTTVIGEPGGRVLMASAGSSRLATAGTGDVLSGIIGAFMARGVAGPEAAALGAHVHGRAARDGHATGLVATDLPELVAGWLSALEPGAG